MKKLLILFVGFLLLLNTAMAEEEDEAGITPDNVLYGLDKALERISLALTFDVAKKAEKRLQIANERLAELKVMVKKGKTKYTEKLTKDYNEEMNETENDIEKARALGKNITLLKEHVLEMTSKHIFVLERVLESAPEQARKGLENALNNSFVHRERLMERFEEKIECLSNEDCGEDEICVNNECEDLEEVECLSNEDCSNEECTRMFPNVVCKENECECVASCESDDNCGYLGEDYSCVNEECISEAESKGKKVELNIGKVLGKK